MKYLLIANAYPNEERIYSNAFLHRRVKGYQAHQLNIEVVVLTTKVKMDEFYDGVKIKYLDELQLADYINNNQFEALLFHFINKKMLDAVNLVATVPRLVIWMHGFEAEPWYSRYYNFLSSNTALERQLERKETFYQEQKEVITELYTRNDLDTMFIFVSNRFKQLYVDPFIGRSPDNYRIIPNPIDNELFTYKIKKAEDRFNICNIRPYTARNYANDITRDVIFALSKKRYFHQLNFSLYGDGPLFNEITEPLSQFKNVHLHKGFVKQEEIALIHQQNGIYLGPTRHDSQGVSLCEAMSSGLVPVSNDIGAISEFIAHRHSGMLAGRDDVKGLVNGIEQLIMDSNLFLSLSQCAHKSIVKKSGSEIVIKNELEVITNE